MSFTLRNTILRVAVLAALTLVPVTAVSTVAGFVLLAWLPGRLLLPIVGIERHWSTAGRTLLSVAVSWSVVPFVLNPLWHVTNDRFVLLGVVCAGIALLAWAGDRRRSTSSDEPPELFFQYRPTLVFAVVVAVFLAGGVILPYWPTGLLGYPIPAEIHDFIKHHAILTSLERRPLPLGNIFYAAGADGPVYSSHFFYLIPATVRAWTASNLSHELAFGLASTLVALPMIGMVYAITKRFIGSEPSASLAAALVSVIGAFDVFLYLPTMLEAGRPLVMIDHWAAHPYVIHNFLFQMIWSPQNVLAVLIVLVGVYILSARGLWRGWLMLGPVLGAAVLGSSVWVAMAALPALAIWAITRPRRLPVIAGVGSAMTLLCLPQLLGYVASASHPGRGLTLEWPANTLANLGRLIEPGIAANLLDLPLALTLEFGAKLLLLALVPVGLWKKVWRDDGLRWLLIAALMALVISSVVRVALEHNDLRHKMLLLTMAFCAIVAGGAVGRNHPSPRWWNPLGWSPVAARLTRPIALLMFLILLSGLATELYEVPLTAVRRYVEEYLAVRTLVGPQRSDLDAEYDAIRYMRYELPAGAVVQAAGTSPRARLAQMICKQIGVMEPWDDLMVFEPPDRRAYLHCADELLTTLRTDDSAERTHAVLRKYQVTHVFVGLVEGDAWDHLERFDDRRYFDEVFRERGIRVVSLQERGTAHPAAPES